MLYDICLCAGAYNKQNPIDVPDLPDEFADDGTTISIEASSFEEAQQFAREQIAAKYRARGYSVSISDRSGAVDIDVDDEIGVEFYGFYEP